MRTWAAANKNLDSNDLFISANVDEVCCKDDNNEDEEICWGAEQKSAAATELVRHFSSGWWHILSQEVDQWPMVMPSMKVTSFFGPVGAGCYIKMTTPYQQPSEHRLVGGSPVLDAWLQHTGIGPAFRPKMPLLGASDGPRGPDFHLRPPRWKKFRPAD